VEVEREVKRSRSRSGVGVGDSVPLPGARRCLERLEDDVRPLVLPPLFVLVGRGR